MSFDKRAGLLFASLLADQLCELRAIVRKEPLRKKHSWVSVLLTAEDDTLRTSVGEDRQRMWRRR